MRLHLFHKWRVRRGQNWDRIPDWVAGYMPPETATCIICGKTKRLRYNL